jgi:hypothetical protein
LKARIALYNEKWDVAIGAASEVMKYEGTEVILDPSFPNLFTYEGQNSKEILFSIQYLFGHRVHPIFRLFGSRNGGGHANKVPSYQLLILTDAKTGFLLISLLYIILQNHGITGIHVWPGLLHYPLPDIQIGKMNLDVFSRDSSSKLTAIAPNAGIITERHLPGLIIRML